MPDITGITVVVNGMAHYYQIQKPDTLGYAIDIATQRLSIAKNGNRIAEFKNWDYYEITWSQ